MTIVVMPPASAASLTCGESQCTWRVDAAGRDDEAAAVEHRGAGVEHDVDAVHRVGVAGAADARRRGRP